MKQERPRISALNLLSIKDKKTIAEELRRKAKNTGLDISQKGKVIEVVKLGLASLNGTINDAIRDHKEPKTKYLRELAIGGIRGAIEQMTRSERQELKQDTPAVIEQKPETQQVPNKPLKKKKIIKIWERLTK